MFVGPRRSHSGRAKNHSVPACPTRSAVVQDRGKDAMRLRSIKRVRLAVACTVGVMALAAGAALAAEPAAASAPTGYSLFGDPGSPDISGLWLGSYSSAPGNRPQDPTPDREITPWAPWPPPLTPEYQKKADERIAAAKKGRQIGDLGARCLSLLVRLSKNNAAIL